MKSATIREQFIQFFTERDHQQLAAVSIVNQEDPSLLFINAGMNPFKELFLGHQPALHSRVVSVQPCLRVSGKHNDLEEVGIDDYHHTFFEMLGNWSFGEYFKKEAISWSWQLLTEVYKLPKDRIYVTVFSGDLEDQLQMDTESIALWKTYLPQDRILPFSKKENFWEMGAIGPCGPCSEIHIDIRSDAQRMQHNGRTLINKGHPHVIEIWNLVFITYDRLASGKLVELPNKHIDTGMGIERLAMVLQHKKSTYDTDLFTPLVQNIEKISKKLYHASPYTTIAMRVIADHIRAVTFVIADGQLPSNTKAGYVVRRILRRAIRYGYTYLDLRQPFMYQLVAVLAMQFKNIYPSLKQQQPFIEQVIEEEEKTFLHTLSTGLRYLASLNQNAIKQGNILDGRIVFELYDTYGFPLDLTMLIAKEQGLIVDELGFKQALQEQKCRSKQAALVQQSDWHLLVNDTSTTFVGYDQLNITATVVKYRKVHNMTYTGYQIVLNTTPFYPEGGGQIGDTGHLIDEQGTKIAVLDTKKEYGQIIHYTEKLPHPITSPVNAVVNEKRRNLTTNNHSATHILHATLKKVLGPHVIQKGSFLNDKLLRFDFTHPSKLNKAELHQIESLIQEKIRANILCQEERNVPFEEAKKRGAAAFFSEKYGTHVRLITFDPIFSVELCGGTHVHATGQLGIFKIVNTTSVGTGIHRIEAVTATAAEEYISHHSSMLDNIKQLLKQPKDIEQALIKLIRDKTNLEKQLVIYQNSYVNHTITLLQEKVFMIDKINILITNVTLLQVDLLKTIALRFRDMYSTLFLVLGTTMQEQVHLVVIVSKDLLTKWYQDAHTIIQELAPLIGGKGGGQPFFAVAGGNICQGLPKALSLAHKILQQQHTDNKKI